MALELAQVVLAAEMASTGMQVLEVLAGERLVALTWAPIQFTQSVIPIGAGLFIVAELLSLPGYWRSVAAGVSLEHPEISQESEA